MLEPKQPGTFIRNNRSLDYRRRITRITVSSNRGTEPWKPGLILLRWIYVCLGSVRPLEDELLSAGNVKKPSVASAPCRLACLTDAGSSFGSKTLITNAAWSLLPRGLRGGGRRPILCLEMHRSHSPPNRVWVHEICRECRPTKRTRSKPQWIVIFAELNAQNTNKAPFAKKRIERDNQLVLSSCWKCVDFLLF